MKNHKPKPSAVYLAYLEFQCGEYSQLFYKCIRASSEEEAEKLLHQYLCVYYGEPEDSEKENDIYYYCNGEVSVEYKSIEKLPSSPQEKCERLFNLLSL